MPIPGHPCTYCVWGTSAGICGTSQERERHICLSALGSSASFVPSTFAGPRAAATSQPPPALWPAPSALILPSDSLPLSALPDWGGGGGCKRPAGGSSRGPQGLSAPSADWGRRLAGHRAAWSSGGRWGQAQPSSQERTPKQESKAARQTLDLPGLESAPRLQHAFPFQITSLNFISWSR